MIVLRKHLFTAAAAAFLTLAAVTSAQEQQAPTIDLGNGQFQNSFVDSNNGVVIDIVTDTTTIAVTMTHTGTTGGYLAFGFSDAGFMTDSTAVIGQLWQDLDSVLKYEMSSRTPAGVVALEDAQQTLTNAQMTFNDTHTVLQFTKPLVEANEFGSIEDISAETNFLYAIGPDAGLFAQHSIRASFAMTLSGDATQVDEEATGDVATGRSQNFVDRSAEDGVVFDIIADTNTETIDVTMTYEGTTGGYLAFAFSDDAFMPDSTAVIGQLWQDMDSVLKYEMSSRTIAGVVALEDAQQTLTNAQMSFNDTHTVLQFTKPLVEENEFGNIEDVSAETNFLYAIGPDSGLLEQHTVRNAFAITLSGEAAQVDDEDEEEEEAPAAGDVVTGRLQNFVDRSAEDGVVFDIIADTDTETIDVTMTYEGTDTGGYLAFAFSDDAFMPDSTAVIGLPDGTTDNVLKYEMTTRTADGVLPLDTAQQTLSNAQLTQNDTHTVLSFTKPLVEEDEFGGTVDITADTNFLYAIGPDSGLLEQHTVRNAFIINLSSGAAVVAENYQTLWRAHGFCMAFAWILIVPSAVASSILRNVFGFFASGVWFKIHRALNITGVLLTVIGFIIAVYIFSQTASSHFVTKTHHKIGLVIFIFALAQAIGGTFRPHVEEHDDEPETTDGEAEIPKKKSISKRTIWEYQHKITGTAAMILGWYNVSSGISEYYARGLSGGDETTLTITIWIIVAIIVFGTVGGLIYHHRCANNN